MYKHVYLHVLRDQQLPEIQLQAPILNGNAQRDT